MSDSSTVVASAPAGDAIDEEALTVSGATVKRQRVRLGGLGAAELQDVRNANPAGTDYGGVVREARVGQATMAASFPVALASDQGTLPTTVGNFPATQAVSAASLPLPTGAATEASLGTDGAAPPTIPGTGIRGWLRSIYDKLAGTLTVGGTVAVSGVTGNVDVTPTTPAANDYLPVRLTDGAAFYTAGAGGGGGAVTVADGANVAQGTTTDAAWTTGAGTVVGLLKAVVGAIKATLTADVTDRAARLLGHVTVDNASLAVTGTFWQTTQPVDQVNTATADYDTGAGTVNQEMMGLALPSAGGPAAGGTSTNPVRTDPTGTTTQPVSGTVGVNNFPATQPVSGTVTGNQGTANTAANAWPGKVTDGTNTAAVKAASTAAVAADPALVVAVSPNNTLTVVNGAAFQLTNIANTTGSTAATAAMQGLVVSLSPNSPLVGLKPFTALGFYAVSGDTGTYSGLAANTPLFSFRWGDATRFGIILKVEVVVFTSVAASTAGITERQLIVARSFTASDTGGTALTPTLNNQKRRTSFGTSLATDIRIGNPITAGTRTLDANPMSRALGWSALNHTGPIIGAQGAAASAAAWATAGSEPIKLLDATNGQDHPIVLAQNEGIIVRIGVVMPTGATQETWVNVVWGEAASY
jgi:hypothetical protein